MNLLKEVCISVGNGYGSFDGTTMMGKLYTISLTFFAPISKELSEILVRNSDGFNSYVDDVFKISTATFNFKIPFENNVVEDFTNILKNRSFAFLYTGSSNNFLDMFSKISLKHIDFSYIDKAFPDEE